MIEKSINSGPENNILRITDNALTEEQVRDWLIDLRGSPYVPESGFDVTCVFKVTVPGMGGKHAYVAGVNAERATHRLTTHAEEGALAAMVTAFGKRATIEHIYEMGSPDSFKGTDEAAQHICVTACGKCRQQMAGHVTEDTKITGFILNRSVDGESRTHGWLTSKINPKTSVSYEYTRPFSEELPNPFTWAAFNPLAGEEQHHATRTASSSVADQDYGQKLIRTGELADEAIHAWLDDLESVDYATGKQQAVALKFKINDQTHYVAGTLMEDAAYLDMSATQAALANISGLFGKELKEGKVDAQAVYALRKQRTKKLDGHLPTTRDYETVPMPLPPSDLEALAEITGQAIPVNIFDEKQNLHAQRTADIVIESSPQTGMLQHVRNEAEQGQNSTSSLLESLHKTFSVWFDRHFAQT